MLASGAAGGRTAEVLGLVALVQVRLENEALGRHLHKPCYSFDKVRRWRPPHHHPPLNLLLGAAGQGALNCGGLGSLLGVRGALAVGVLAAGSGVGVAGHVV